MNLRALGFLLFIASGIISCVKNGSPNGSPQKSEIIYYDKNSREQVVVQVFSYDGKSEKNLTHDSSYNYWWARVSPDKTKFLCYRSPRLSNNYLDNKSNDYANADLVVFNIDGSNPRVIIPKGSYGWREQGVAKFSPDGKNILMAAECKDSARGNYDFHWRLVITDINGQHPKIISTRNSLFADPAWSPDGKRIVYVTLPPGMLFGFQDQFELYVADYNPIAGEIQNEVRLTNDSFYCFDPCFSPDGKYIAFSRAKFLELIPLPGKADIIRIRPDGTDAKAIMDDDKINGVPYWSPNGRRVYFHTLGWGLQFSIASCDGILGGDKKIILAGGGSADNIYSTPQPVLK